MGVNFLSFNVQCVFQVCRNEFTLSLSSFLTVIISSRINCSNGSIFLIFFFKYWGIYFIKKQCFTINIMKFNIRYEKVPYVVVMRFLSKILLTSETWRMFFFINTTVWQRLGHSLAILVIVIHFENLS